MTTFAPIYRVTGYVRRSLDANEVTVATPLGSSPVHTKPFRMATKACGQAVRIGTTSPDRYFIRNPVSTWPTTQVTVEAWVRLDTDADTVQDYNTIFSYAASTHMREVWMGINTSGGLFRLEGAIDNVFFTETLSSGYPDDGKWHHVMMTWNSSGGQARLYRDGVLTGTASSVKSSYTVLGGGSVVLGQTQNSIGGSFGALMQCKGEIDEVRVYSRALALTEIQQNFAGRFMNDTGLVARWGFDDATLLGRDTTGVNELTPVNVLEGTDDTILHFEPYMFAPTGRLGAMDLLTKRVGVGSMTVKLQDQRVTAGGVNTDRFLTAFFGDGKGANRMAGTKLFFEYSENGGVFWQALFTGRIQNVQADGKLAYSVTARDMTEDLKRMKLFVAAPHSLATGASVGSVLPVGFNEVYGLQPITTPLRATLATNRTWSYQGVSYTVNILTLITGTPGAPNVARQDNVMTQNLWDLIQPLRTGAPDDSPIFRMVGGAKAHIKVNGGAANGTEGDVRVGLLHSQTLFANGLHHVTQLSIMTLDATEPGFIALPTDSTSIDFYVYGDNEISVRNPLMINDVPLAILWTDVLSGLYSERWSWLDRHTMPAGVSLGDPKFKIPHHVTSFNALAADVRIPPLRLLVTESTDALSWLEKVIFPLGFSYRLDGFGQVVPVDLRTPTSDDLIGLPIIGDDDLEEGESAAEWEHERSESVSRARIFTYVDTPIGIEQLQPRGDPRAPDSLPIIQYAMLQPQAIEALVPNLGSLDVGDREERIEYVGLRSMVGETLDGRRRSDWAEDKARTATQHLKKPYGSGAVPAVLRCRRVGDTNRFQGSLVLVSVSWLPDPVTFRKGGIRLMRVTDRVETGGVNRILHLLDMGSSGVTAVPTLAQPAQQTGNRLHGVKTAVTRNAVGDDVEVWAAITDTSVSTAPAETSALWFLVEVVRGANRDSTYSFAPAGKRVWLRGRSVPSGDAETPQVPSAFQLAAGTGFADTVSLTAPTSPVEITKSARAFRVGWTPQPTVVDGTSFFLPLEILIATPVGDPRTLYRRLGIGATYVDILGTEPSTTYRVGIRHYDGFGGVSAEITIDVTTTSTALVAPAMRAVSVVTGSL